MLVVTILYKQVMKEDHKKSVCDDDSEDSLVTGALHTTMQMTL